jgi:hypothetical protein
MVQDRSQIPEEPPPEGGRRRFSGRMVLLVVCTIGLLLVGAIGVWRWRGWSGLAVAVGAVIAAALLLGWVVELTSRMAPPVTEQDLKGITRREQLEVADNRVRLGNDLRNSAFQLLLIVAALAGALLGFMQLGDDRAKADADRALARRGQLTDRYTAAVGQLGDDDRNVRLGGIYALARIMDESHDDQPTIVEVLMAFVRDQAPLRDRNGKRCGKLGYGYDDPKSKEDLDHPWADVQAALTVMGGRSPALDYGKVKPDLSRTCLIGANMIKAQLVDVDLTFTDLTRADLADAHLDKATMASTSMGHANLTRASLTKATITNTEMDSMKVAGANFAEATLRGVNLTCTKLSPDQRAAARRIVDEKTEEKSEKECRQLK